MGALDVWSGVITTIKSLFVEPIPVSSIPRVCFSKSASASVIHRAGPPLVDRFTKIPLKEWCHQPRAGSARKTSQPTPISIKDSIYKTVKAIFWSWLSLKSPGNIASRFCFARKRTTPASRCGHHGSAPEKSFITLITPVPFSCSQLGAAFVHLERVSSG